MSFRASCPHCQGGFIAEDEYEGKTGRCGKCEKQFEILRHTTQALTMDHTSLLTLRHHDWRSVFLKWIGWGLISSSVILLEVAIFNIARTEATVVIAILLLLGGCGLHGLSLLRDIRFSIVYNHLSEGEKLRTMGRMPGRTQSQLARKGLVTLAILAMSSVPIVAWSIHNTQKKKEAEKFRIELEESEKARSEFSESLETFKENEKSRREDRSRAK